MLMHVRFMTYFTFCSEGGITLHISWFYNLICIYCFLFQLAVVRQVLRKELGLKIVEVDSEKALVEGGDVLWTGRSSWSTHFLLIMQLYCHQPRQ